MNDPTILFFGYGSEYSLAPLCAYMVAQGCDCVEIDMLTHPDPVATLKDLAGRELVFVTSAHPLYDDRNFFYYKTTRKIISALHIISSLEPRLNVFYPHDYKDPIKEEELSYLALFDLLLWPFSRTPEEYDDLVISKSVGWIKHQPRADAAGAERRYPAVFFLGAYQYYLNAGFDRFFYDFEDLLTSGVAVKLARWHDNDLFEEYLRSRGVDVVPSEANSIEVMESCDVVISHALSSVAVEACHLGKRVVYIRDPRFDYKDPIAEFRGVGNIAFVDSALTASRLDASGLKANAPQMKRFDFQAAHNAIITAYRGRVNS